MNIVRIAKDMDWINDNLPTLIKFWNDVEHYRNIGIENHKEYIKKNNKKNKMNDCDNIENKKKCIIID